VFLAEFNQLRELGVGKDEALIEAVRRAFSQTRHRRNEWRLAKGRALLERLRDEDTPT
jgi:hypothetical protein